MHNGIESTQSYHVTPPIPSQDWGKGQENAVLPLFSLVESGSRPHSELCQVGTYPSHEKPVEKERQRNAPGTREIPLTKGLFALVDEADYEAMAAHSWHATRRPWGKTWYAVRSVPNPRKPGRRTKVYMHREIAAGESIKDHKDGNGLNNTRQNLRPATIGQNNRNIGKPRHGVTSQYKGVSWNAHAGKFQATVRYHGKNIYLGLFVDEKEAAYEYDRVARFKFGSFSRLNFPLPPMVIPSRLAPMEQA